MPSRKRSKGKSRKSAAKASATPNDGGGGQTQRQQQEPQQNNEQLLGQLINNLSLEEGTCYHGRPPHASGSCGIFIHCFGSGLIAAGRSTANFLSQEIPDMPQARAMSMFYMILKLLKEAGLLEVCNNASSRKLILSHLVSLGTDYLIKGGVRHTEMAVTVALALLKVEALENESTEDDFGVVMRAFVQDCDRDIVRFSSNRKMRDLVQGGDRDIVRFFSKRIICSCLKEKYAQVKSEPKLGSCRYCTQRKERRELMVCALCRLPQYCSKACQEAHWPEHKVSCNSHMKNKT